MADQTVQFTIRVKSDDLARAAKDAGVLADAVEKTGRSAASAGPSFLKMTTAIVAGQAAFAALSRGFSALTSVFSTAIQAAAEQEAATIKLAQTLRSTGQYSVAYAKSLDELSGALQKTSRFGDDAILSVERQLVMFGAAGKDIPKLTQAVLDLAEGYGKDLPEAASMVAKALAGNFTMFQRLGIRVGETGTQAEKFAKLMAQLEKQVGGQAAAAVTTFTGALERMKNAFGEVLERLGGIIVNNAAVKASIAALGEFFFKLADRVGDGARSLDRFVTAGVLRLLESIPSLIRGIGALGDAFIGLGQRVAAVLEMTALGMASSPIATLLGISDAAAQSAGELGLLGQRLQEMRTTWGETTAGMAEDAEQAIGPTVEKLRAGSAAIERERAELERLGQAALAEGGGGIATVAFADALRASSGDIANLSTPVQELAQSLGVLPQAAGEAGRGFQLLGADADAASQALAKASEAARDEIRALEAEVAARQAAIGTNKTALEVEAEVVYAKTLAATGSQALADRERELYLIREPLKAQAKDLADGEKALADARDKLAQTQGSIGIIQEGLAAGESAAQIQAKLAAASEKYKVKTVETADAVAKLTEQTTLLNETEGARAEQLLAAIDSAEDSIVKSQAQLAIYQDLEAGVISLTEAETRLAIVEQTGGQVADANTEARLRQAEALKQQVDAAKKSAETWNVGDAIGEQFAKVIEGIALGTNKGISAMQALKQGATAIWGTMLKNMVTSKLGFDKFISKNFLQDIPGFLAQGMSFLGGIFKNGLGALGSIFNGVGSGVQGILGWMFGSGGTGGVSGAMAGGGIGGTPGGGNLINLLSGVPLVGSALGSLGAFATNLGVLGLAGVVPAWGLASAGITLTSGYTAGMGMASAILGGHTALTAAGAAAAGTGGTAAGAAVGGLSATGIGAIVAAVIAVLFANITANDVYRKISNFTFKQYDIFMAQKKAIDKIPVIGWAAEAFGDRVAKSLFLREKARPVDKIMLEMIAPVGIAPIPGNLLAKTGWLDKVWGVNTMGTVLMHWFTKFLVSKKNEVPFFGLGGKMQERISKGPIEQIIEERYGDRRLDLRKPGGGFYGIDERPPQYFTVDERGRTTGQWPQVPRAEGVYLDAQKEYIKRQQESLKLTDKQIQQFKALGLAFSGQFSKEFLGKNFGQEMVKTLARVADMLGSLVAGGAEAEEAMAAVKKAIENLGPPTEILRDLNKLYTQTQLNKTTGKVEFNSITVEDYRDALAGLAQVWFTDLPRGVDAAKVAMKELDEAIAKHGDRAVVTFEELSDAMKYAAQSAQLITPAIEQFFQAIMNGVDFAQASEDFYENLKKGIAETVAQAMIDGLLQAVVDATMLGPFFERIDKAFKAWQKGEITFDQYMQEVRAAGIQAVSMLQTLTPILETVKNWALDIKNALGLGDAVAANMTAAYQLYDQSAQEIIDAAASVEDAAIQLATALAQVAQAQEDFLDRLDTKIFANRNDVEGLSAVAQRRMDRDAERFAALQREFIGVDPESAAAAAAKYTISERLAALAEMEALVDDWLATRIAQIEAERDAIIEVHQERIDTLTEERDAIQDAAEAALEAKQDELDLINEQLDAVNESLAQAEKWKAVLDSTRDVLQQLRTGELSPSGPMERVSLLQAEFDRQLAIFRGTGTDEQRQAAAGELATLGPQLLQLILNSGIAQSSESYRTFYDQIMAILMEIEGVAGTGAKDYESLQEQQRDLLQQQKDLQKEISDLQKETNKQLRAIDKQIETERDAIVAAQRDAEAKIDRAREQAANIYEWIRGQGDALFAARIAELNAGLTSLGVTEVDLKDIQWSSLQELMRIRAILEGAGINVAGGFEHPAPGGGGGGGGGGTGGELQRTGAGKFGLTTQGQKQIYGFIKTFDIEKNADVYEAMNAVIDEVERPDAVDTNAILTLQAAGGLKGTIVSNILALFHDIEPLLLSNERRDRFSGWWNFLSALSSIISLIKNRSGTSDVLGLGYVTGDQEPGIPVGPGDHPELLAQGGLVRSPTLAWIGEGGESELVLPLESAVRNANVRRFFASLVTPETDSVRSYATGGMAVHPQLARIAERGPEVLAPYADLPGIFAAALRQPTTSAAILDAVRYAGVEEDQPVAWRQHGPTEGATTPTVTQTVNVTVTLPAITVAIDADVDLSDAEATKRTLKPVFAALIREAINEDEIRARIGRAAREVNAGAPR